MLDASLGCRSGADGILARLGHFYELGSFFVGALILKAILLGVFIRALNLGKFHLASPTCRNVPVVVCAGCFTCKIMSHKPRLSGI